MVVTLLGSLLVFVADIIAKGGLLISGAIMLVYDHPAPVWSEMMYFLGIGVVHVTGDGLLVSRQGLCSCQTNKHARRPGGAISSGRETLACWAYFRWYLMFPLWVGHFFLVSITA
jgi:hypothetical protein